MPNVLSTTVATAATTLTTSHAPATRHPTQPARTLLLFLLLFLNEARFDLLRMLRTRAFSLSVIGFPVMFYALFGLSLNRGTVVHGIGFARYLLGSYSVFGVIGAALFGIGVGLASERASGWLELKRASPMPPAAYLFAKCTTAIVFGLIVTTLLTALGIFFAHIALTPTQFLGMLALTAVGAVPFACMGLVIALVAPANAAPGITNMLYLPMSFCGGLWLPISLLPDALQHFAVILPTYHLSQLMTGVLGYPMAGSVLSHILGLLGFTLLMLGIAAIAHRRLEQAA